MRHHRRRGHGTHRPCRRIWQGRREIRVEAGDIVSLPVQLSVAPEQLPSTTNEVTFTLKDADDNGTQVEAKSRFIGPQIR